MSSSVYTGLNFSQNSQPLSERTELKKYSIQIFSKHLRTCVYASYVISVGFNLDAFWCQML
jgi:hypothetical protein